MLSDTKLIAAMSLIVTVLMFVGTAHYGWNVFEVISGGNTIDSCSFVQPQFGRIECEPVSHTSVSHVEVQFFGDNRNVDGVNIIKCGDDENTRECDYSYKSQDIQKFALTPLYFTYQKDGSANCPIGGDNWCTIRANVNEETMFLYKEPQGTRIKVGGFYIDHLIWKEWISGTVKSYWIPYGLNVYDSGQKIRYNTQSCDLSSLGYIERKNVCVESDGTACSKTKQTDRLNFDDWVNYLSSWTYAPIDINNKVVMWNGQKAYCQVNTIYSIGEFKTEGSCYKYPKTRLASVECCPGMKSANSVCGDDFKWHLEVVGECDANRPCQSGYDCINNKCVRRAECISDFQCTGQGNWYVDYSQELTISRQSCISGQCQIVESKKVQCTPPDKGCPSGQVCNPNKGYICEDQEGPDIVCGDNVCSKPYESEITCPSDCKVSKTDLSKYLIYLILVPFGALLGYAKNRDLIYAGIGAFIGLITALIIDFLLKNWILTLVGVALGGIGLYFFGGAILTALLMIITVFRK